MSEDVDLEKLAAEAERKAQAGEVMSAQEAFIASLPQHIRRQMELGLIDKTRIPMEDLMRMAREAAVDGDVLEGATRGDSHHPLDYKRRTSDRQSDQQKDPEIAPPEDPGDMGAPEQDELEAPLLLPDASASIHGAKKPKKQRLPVKPVNKEKLGTLSPNTASSAPAGRDKGKDGRSH